MPVFRASSHTYCYIITVIECRQVRNSKKKNRAATIGCVEVEVGRSEKTTCRDCPLNCDLTQIARLVK